MAQAVSEWEVDMPEEQGPQYNPSALGGGAYFYQGKPEKNVPALLGYMEVLQKNRERLQASGFRYSADLVKAAANLSAAYARARAAVTAARQQGMDTLPVKSFLDMYDNMTRFRGALENVAAPRAASTMKGVEDRVAFRNPDARDRPTTGWREYLNSSAANVDDPALWRTLTTMEATYGSSGTLRLAPEEVSKLETLRLAAREQEQALATMTAIGEEGVKVLDETIGDVMSINQIDDILGRVGGPAIQKLQSAVQKQAVTDPEVGRYEAERERNAIEIEWVHDVLGGRGQEADPARNKQASIIGDPKFQRWARENGIKVGWAKQNPDGTVDPSSYVQRWNDNLAIRAFVMQFNKNPWAGAFIAVLPGGKPKKEYVVARPGRSESAEPESEAGMMTDREREPPITERIPLATSQPTKFAIIESKAGAPIAAASRGPLGARLIWLAGGDKGKVVEVRVDDPRLQGLKEDAYKTWYTRGGNGAVPATELDFANFDTTDIAQDANNVGGLPKPISASKVEAKETGEDLDRVMGEVAPELVAGRKFPMRSGDTMETTRVKTGQGEKVVRDGEVVSVAGGGPRRTLAQIVREVGGKRAERKALKAAGMMPKEEESSLSSLGNGEEPPEMRGGSLRERADILATRLFRRDLPEPRERRRKVSAIAGTQPYHAQEPPKPGSGAELIWTNPWEYQGPPSPTPVVVPVSPGPVEPQTSAEVEATKQEEAKAKQARQRAAILAGRRVQRMAEGR